MKTAGGTYAMTVIEAREDLGAGRAGEAEDPLERVGHQRPASRAPAPSRGPS